jgi:LysM repeat protein
LLYFVQKGDTLTSIADRFETTAEAIFRANLICNADLIFIGQPLIIPEAGTELPQSGATPYYILQPGDSLFCISARLGIPVSILARINNLPSPNLIYPGMELLTIFPSTDDIEQLKLRWDRTPDEDCMVYGFAEYGLYYIGSFEWQAFGPRAIPHLLDLLQHRCAIVRQYAVISLGRLGLDGEVIDRLNDLLNDPTVINLAKAAIKRIQLVQNGFRRIHVTTSENILLNTPDLTSTSYPLPEGSEITVLRWYIPSPTSEEGPRGGIQIFDYVQDKKSGRIGFVPRIGYNEINFI